MMKRFICMIMAMLMLMSAASAQILTTGSVNVRSGPGLDYETIGSIAEGKVVVFRNGIETVEEDERGVEWYHIGYKNINGWISSKYTKKLVGPVKEVSSKKISRYKEVAQYFDKVAEDLYVGTLKEAAEKIGLDGYNYPYGEEEVPSVYYNESLLFGVKNMPYMSLIGPGYTIHGAAVGMKIEEAAKKLRKAGFVGNDDDPACCGFTRIASENSWLDEGEEDSYITLYEENGIVYRIVWDAYSG